MKQNNKHTPLSTEELVKLLEQNANSEANLTELDDFEKEAFEGFSGHTSPAEAKELMTEIQSDISKKAFSILNGEQTDSSKKNKIIWFSAAASLLLIIALSVLFIKKSDVVTEQSLALNENKSVQESSAITPKITNTIVAESKLETIPEEAKMDNAGGKSKVTIQQTVSTELSISTVSKGTGKSADDAGPTSGGLVSTSSALSNSTEYAYYNTVSAISKDNNTNTDVEKIAKESNDSDTKEQDDAFKYLSDKKTVTNEIASVPASASAGIKSDEKENSSLAYDKATKYKTDAKKENSKQPVSLAETKTVKTSADGDRMETESRAYTTVAQNTTATKPAQNTLANYIGGEAFIKEYILAYHKKINSTEKLQGTFMIIATIKKDGKLEVISINNVSKDYSNCKNFLKEALNTMKEWNSATTNGTKVDSEIQFIVAF